MVLVVVGVEVGAWAQHQGGGGEGRPAAAGSVFGVSRGERGGEALGTRTRAVSAQQGVRERQAGVRVAVRVRREVVGVVRAVAAARPGDDGRDGVVDVPLVRDRHRPPAMEVRVAHEATTTNTAATTHPTLGSHAQRR